jgi:putative FmdB family regulatory protein
MDSGANIFFGGYRMPTYEYHCKSCGHGFEIRQKITDLPIAECPKCQGKTEKLISGGIGFILKGSGGCAAQGGMKPACGVDPSRCGQEPLCGQMHCHEG